MITDYKFDVFKNSNLDNYFTDFETVFTFQFLMAATIIIKLQNKIDLQFENFHLHP